MRHRAKGRQLSRTASHKKALLANLATSLFRHDRIVTTEAKAKELRPYAERLITLARRGRSSFAFASVVTIRSWRNRLVARFASSAFLWLAVRESWRPLARWRITPRLPRSPAPAAPRRRRPPSAHLRSPRTSSRS